MSKAQIAALVLNPQTASGHVGSLGVAMVEAARKEITTQPQARR